MALLDLLGRRWTLRMLWEMRGGALSFRALRERCEDMSPSVLNLRLQELREAGIVDLQSGEGFMLTSEGERLLVSLAPLHDWAERWARRT